MTDMHNKTTLAKTPSEPDVLMSEHTKTMQDGMNMMSVMSPVGMGDMGGMRGHAKHDAKPGPFWTSRYSIGLVVFVAIAAYFLPSWRNEVLTA